MANIGDGSTMAGTDRVQLLVDSFQRRFGKEPLIISSPGRVNLIGEHTDYNEGFVLPGTIDKNILFAVAASGSRQCRLYADDLSSEHSFDVDNYTRAQHSWPNYLIGVVDQLKKAGYDVPGFYCIFGGTIPIGAGLSSSAAIEAGLAFALNELFSLKIEKRAMVSLAQKAENEFVGVRCGIMDQFANIFGEKNKLIKLDCRSLDFEYVPFDMQDVRIVLCDSKVKHSLASGEYNIRRTQCEEGVRILKTVFPEITSLRDVSLEQLRSQKENFTQVIYNRCRYVLEENARVADACEALALHDFERFGLNMYNSHFGLRDDYEVSCTELDLLVDIARKSEGVFGSRMMGGGFGGCTINLVRNEFVDAFTVNVKQEYAKVVRKEPSVHITKIESGTCTVSNEH